MSERKLRPYFVVGDDLSKFREVAPRTEGSQPEQPLLIGMGSSSSVEAQRAIRQASYEEALARRAEADARAAEDLSQEVVIDLHTSPEDLIL